MRRFYYRNPGLTCCGYKQYKLTENLLLCKMDESEPSVYIKKGVRLSLYKTDYIYVKSEKLWLKILNKEALQEC